ncbi:non-ribosomal peptide synthetase [Pedobacter sp. D749]|uniref:non-ribosomal peptide synthetase n=1 Tax=Pedobacter sp. D749 TaxID=2856523 RepID=UPI001C563F11|nr:non-ribosomal peptide synthetase [Pedobacter sp. D749]QXU43273.1 amino acid adenylation domain-containing protein [Pedobacter sp. D749]
MNEVKKKYFETSLLQQNELAGAIVNQGYIDKNQPLFIYIDEDINYNKLCLAVNELIARHELLRTGFKVGQNKFKLYLLDEYVYELTDNSKEISTLEYLKKLADKRKFCSEDFPLFDFGLHKIGKKQFVLLFNKPAFISDAISDGILMSELEKIYKDQQLPKIAFQHLDFLLWQNDFIKTEKGEKAKDSLKRLLATQTTDFFQPEDIDCPNEISCGLNDPLNISINLLEKITLYTSKHKINVDDFLLSVWYVFLQKYTRNDHVLVNCVKSCREADWKQVSGNFENVFPMSRSINKNDRFIDFCINVNRNAVILDKYKYYPSEGLKMMGDQYEDENKNTGMGFIFCAEVNQQTRWIDLHSHLGTSLLKRCNFNLKIVAQKDELNIYLINSTKKFSTDAVNRIKDCISTIITSVLDEEHILIRDVDFTSESEKKRLLYKFNEPYQDLGEIKPIHVLFEEQATLFPDTTAVIHNDYNLSYQELNQKSNKLAHLLISLGVQRKEFVGVFLDRSFDLLSSMLAIFKSGASYVPFDKQNPVERSKFLIDNSNAKILFTDSDTVRNNDWLILDLPHIDYIICIDELKSDYGSLSPRSKTTIIDCLSYSNLSTDNPENVNSIDDWSYMLYTSGSTGDPKGAILTHQGAVNHIYAEYKFLNLAQGFKFLQSANISSDISVWQYLAPLLHGGTVIIIDQVDLLDFNNLISILNKTEVTLAEFVPSYLNAFLDFVESSGTTSKTELFYLQSIMMTGEELPVELVGRWKKFTSSIKLINAYGPCEASDDITQYLIDDTFDPRSKRVPIGKPLANLNLFVLDENVKLLPIGFTGEIYVSGIGVGEGYWKDIKKTLSKFIPNPFPDTLGEIMYRTGDLGRWKADGNLEFLGRIDHQAQIRGNRVETAEIDHLLGQHHHIVEGITGIKKDNNGQEYLVSYIIRKLNSGAGDEETFRSELTIYLKRFLPSFMVPAYWVFLKEFPKNLSGKIDLKLLKEIDERSLTGSYVTPVGDLEIRISSIWEAVLNKDKISVEANFFQVGGHSLKAVQVTAKVYKELNVVLKLRDFFNAPTIRQQAELIANEKNQNYQPINPIKKNQFYDLSFGQRRLWLFQQYKQTGQAYNMLNGYSMTGELDYHHFEKAINYVILKHEILRTRFITVGGEPKQVVEEFGGNYALDYEDLRNNTEAHQHLDVLVDCMAAFQFDLATARLFQFKLLEMEDNSYVFLTSFHHIIMDGWSIDVFIKELAIFYNDLCSGIKPEVTPPLLQYKDIASWSNALIKNESNGGHRSYWLTQLQGELPRIELPFDFKRPTSKSYNGGSVEHVYDQQQISLLNNFCRREGVTTFMVLLSAVKLLLFRYSDQKDLIIGIPSAGRTHPDMEDQLGFYVNTLPIRSCVKPFESFRELLDQVKGNMLDAFNHDLYPFDKIVSDLEIVNDQSRTPIFDVMVTHQKSLLDRELRLSNLVVDDYYIPSNTSKFDLTFNFLDDNDLFSLNIVYNTDIFKKERIVSLLGHLTNLIYAVLADADKPMNEVDYIGEVEKTRILKEFNRTETEYPDQDSLVSLFRKQVSKTPTKTVLVFESGKLTYTQFDLLTNLLGNYLVEKYNINQGDVVSLFMDRSLEMVISIWALLKIGAIYVPLDPTFPEERISYIIKDSQAKLILTKTKKVFEDLNIDQYTVNLEVLAALYPNKEISFYPKPEDDAYIIYTSGSTGNPKGVIIKHKGIVNRLNWQWLEYSFTDADIVLQKTNYVFDVSTWELFLPVCFGCQMVLCPQEVVYDPLKMVQFIDYHKITRVHFVPTMYNYLLDSLNLMDKTCLQSLRNVYCGGEPLSTKLVNKHYKNLKAQLFNWYGPTEASVDVTAQPVYENDEIIPIGYPIHNTKLYIVDTNLQLKPIGVTGEIGISGVGLAKGYLNNEVLSNSKFIDNPYEPGQKLYLTGDLGCWEPDGAILYFGRSDDQVKIRGHRIELGEIENVLKKNTDILDVVVLAVENPSGDKSLTAYLISEIDDIVSKARDRLRAALPDYMHPAQYVILQRFPLTASGKLDKQALSKIIEFKSPQSDKQQRKTSALENTLLEVWKDVLGKQDILIDDNFFEIGGDSIKAIQIAVRLQKHKFKIEVKNIFEHPFIDKLANFIKPFVSTADQSIVEGSILLTPIQRYFFSKKLLNINHYNQSVVLYHSKLGIDEVKFIFLKLYHHHDALRITFLQSENERMPEQFNRGGAGDIPVLEFDIRGDDDLPEFKRISNDLQKSLNIYKGELFKIALFHMNDGERLLIICHHLIIDGVSWRILLEDITTLFQQFRKQQQLLLPEKTDSFKTWSETLALYTKSENFQNEKEYWNTLEVNDGFILPRRIKQAGKRRDIKTLTFTLDEHKTTKLISNVNQFFESEINDILLSALIITFQKLFNAKSLLIMLEGHGREPISDTIDVNRTVGWFTSVFPVKLIADQNREFSQQIEKVKKKLRSIPNKGIGYGILKYLTAPEVMMNMQADILFNYLGQFDSDESDFQVISDSAGHEVGQDEAADYPLEITGMIAGKALLVSFNYDSKLFQENLIIDIHRAYQQTLDNIISNATVDFHQTLSPEALDHINSLFE